MTKQHSPDGETPPEQQQKQHRHKALREGTTKRPMPARLTLAAGLGALLAVLVWGVFTHSGLNRYPTHDTLAGQQAALVLLSDPATGTKRDHNDVNIVITSSESPPTPPVPIVPQPAPVVPHPTHVFPHPHVFPQPIPVVPQPPPVIPQPIPVVPQPIPVVPQPIPVVPRPAVPLEQVPNLIGHDLATAEQLLARKGLTVGAITHQGSGEPAGTVLQTNPGPNTVVPSGSAVDLFVAG